MPFVYLPNYDFKVLIDSGASNSIINPNVCHHFQDYLFQKPFTVKSLHRVISSDQNLNFPLLNELGINEYIQFIIVPWHDKFDALIGSKDLKRLNAKIDYKNNTLEIGNKQIPFYYQYMSGDIHSKPEQKNGVLTIPVTIENGDVVIPPISLNRQEITPEIVSCAKNGYCQIPSDKEINFHQRIEVEPFSKFETFSPSKSKTNFKIQDDIRTDHLNPEEKSAVMKTCHEFKDIFYNENSDLTFTNAIKHKIRTKNEEPIYIKSFRHPHSMREEIKVQIRNLLDNKIIRPSISPYSAPVWIVPKKIDSSGKRKYRMVIDYRKLNENTIEDKYPLPRIDEILDNLGKCCYFTTLDLAQGFHQIEMDPESVEKTAFTVENGHFEYIRMPFGLKNAPSTFQRVMDNVLKEFIHKFCFVYMDDIVIFSKSLKQHLDHLRIIFKKLRQFNLKVQLKKSEFLSKDVTFLGHVITPTGIKPNPSKIEAVKNFPLPSTQKQIKSFLGLIGYYRRFIRNFAKIVAPMTKCLKKGSKLNTDQPEYVEAFNLCKELLSNAPILAYPDFTKRFTLTTDASNVALGSVLSQNGRPIAYYSRTLNTAERNYSTIEKELLAILDSCKHFRPYLYGQNFTVETDHNPLVWLYKIKEPNSRLVRWKLKLEEFDFDIKYRKGKENLVADALSRVEICNFDSDSMTPQVDGEESPTIDDDEFERLLNETNQPHSNDNLGTTDYETVPINNTENTAHSVSNNDNGKVIPISEEPVNHFKNRIVIDFAEAYHVSLLVKFRAFKHYRVMIRKSMLIEDLTKALLEIIIPDRSYGIFVKHPDIQPHLLSIVKNNLNNSINLRISRTLLADITKLDQQRDIINKYHELNHNGIIETYQNLKRKYYWPNMKTLITHIINQCDDCLRAKYERHPYQALMQGPMTAKRPFDVVHIDTFTFLNSKFLTLIDLFSKYGQAYLIKDLNTITIANKLRHYIAHHNKPKRIVADRGTEFHSSILKEFCKLCKIDIHFITGGNPSSNSPIERFHSTILEKLKIINIQNPNDTPADKMITAITNYNQSIHSGTRYSPFYLLYGPYEDQVDYDLDMTIYENYNDKRRKELLPFFDEIERKNRERSQKAIDKHNENKTSDVPDVVAKEMFVQIGRHRNKGDPKYKKTAVRQQKDKTIEVETDRNKITTVSIERAKRLRNVPLLQLDQRPPSPQPGPSSRPD